MLWCPAGTIPQVHFAEDTSANQDDQTISRGRQKKNGNRLLEKTSAEKEKGKRKAWKWRDKWKTQAALGTQRDVFVKHHRHKLSLLTPEK